MYGSQVHSCPGIDEVESFLQNHIEEVDSTEAIEGNSDDSNDREEENEKEGTITSKQ